MIRRIAFLAISLAASSAALAEVKLNPLFTDHAVLQRDAEIPVCGTATPGEKVRLELPGAWELNPATRPASGEMEIHTNHLENVRTTVTADAVGMWTAHLPAHAAGGPFELVVKGDSNEVRRTDILIGDVWLCSGQSNMDFVMSKKVASFAGIQDEEKEIAAANWPKIRQFKVDLKMTDSPDTQAKGEWLVCNSENAPKFSAVAYCFGRELHKTLPGDVPIGLLVTSYGASTAQAWTSRDALLSNDKLKQLVPEYEQKKSDFASGAAQTKYEQALKDWEKASADAKAAGKPEPRKPGAPKDPSQDQHNPSVLYNGMVAPLVPYAFRGAIWYQGESNGYNNEIYLPLMQTLIADWRKAWNTEFSFLSVQLAGYHAPATQPADRSQIASVREAQWQTMLTVPNAYTVTAFDIGDAKNVHPKNKQEVGRRLALAARANVYGEKDLEWTGPLLKSATVEGSTVRLQFTHAKELVPAGFALTGFALRTEDGWSWADARIDSNAVLVRVPEGKSPIEVRYAWADNPVANLVNGERLPALPFRVELGKEGH
ncbi:MAG: sialate O-acetylesterase [Tepidisphaeraceae bacterium]